MQHKEINMEQIPGFMVFWLDKYPSSDRFTPNARHFEMNEMSNALKFMEELRKASAQFVTMVSQNSSSVGKAGVASIVDGKTPDGEVYEWSKAGRAGKMKRSERTMSALQGTDNVEVKLDDE
jgi:hypothetical protein